MSDQAKREILRPQFNVDLTLALRYATPREIEGRYGAQMMFTVLHEGDEKLIFFDPVTAGRIEALGLAAGERFTIRKQELNQGRKKGIEWVITREAESPRQQGSSPAATVAAATTPHGRVSDSRTSDSQRSTKAPARGPQVVPMPAPETAPAAAAAPSPLQLAGQVMGGCLIAAIDALAIAQEYATRYGLKLQWNEEDVRATGASLFIQHHRDAGFAARPQTTAMAASGGSR